MVKINLYFLQNQVATLSMDVKTSSDFAEVKENVNPDFEQEYMTVRSLIETVPGKYFNSIFLTSTTFDNLMAVLGWIHDRYDFLSFTIDNPPKKGEDYPFFPGVIV